MDGATLAAGISPLLLLGRRELSLERRMREGRQGNRRCVSERSRRSISPQGHLD